MDETLVCVKNAQPKKYGRRNGHIQFTETAFYNLDVIISVGYRVKSINGTKLLSMFCDGNSRVRRLKHERHAGHQTYAQKASGMP